MRWGPDIVGQWIARVPANHIWSTITGAGEMKRNGWVWRSGGMKFMAGENGRNPEKNLPRPRFVHHETHMEWPRCKLGTPVVGGERLTTCATRSPHFHFLINFFTTKFFLLLNCSTWSKIFTHSFLITTFASSLNSWTHKPGKSMKSITMYKKVLAFFCP